MSIFKKKFIRHSEVTIGIEADSEAEAQKAFDEWYENDQNNWCELSERLSECEKDSEEWVSCYPNMDFYNRYNNKVDDFIINKPKRSQEPAYDLYIRNEDLPINMIKKYRGIPMSSVLDKLSEFNREYILKHKLPPYGLLPPDNGSFPSNRVLYFEAERRH